jgi:tetratricopeptide (TPR) repeat protein
MITLFLALALSQSSGPAVAPLVQPAPAATPLVTPAANPNHAQAVALARQSITDFNVGDFGAALAEATQAYKLEPNPGLLYNLAQAHRALKHWERAEFFYRGYLRGKPNARNRAEVERLITEMEGEVYKAQQEAKRVAAAKAAAQAAKDREAARRTAQNTAAVPLVLSAQPSKGTIPAADSDLTYKTEEPKKHSHVAGITLVSIAAAMAAYAVVGFVENNSYNGWLSNAQAHSLTVKWGSQPMTQSTAEVFDYSAWAASGVAAVCATTGLIIW